MGIFHIWHTNYISQHINLYNFSLLFLGQGLLLEHLLNLPILIQNSISCVIHEGPGANLRTHFYQIVINCFPLEALTYHTVTNVSFVLLWLLIIYIRIQKTWMSLILLASWNPLNFPAFDLNKHFSSVTECHLPSSVTYFTLDKSLFPTPTQRVKWGDLLRLRISCPPTSVGKVWQWTWLGTAFKITLLG